VANRKHHDVSSMVRTIIFLVSIPHSNERRLSPSINIIILCGGRRDLRWLSRDEGVLLPKRRLPPVPRSVSVLYFFTRPGGVGRFLSSSTAAASAAVHTVSPSRDKTTNLLGAPSPETAAFAGTGITDYGLSHPYRVRVLCGERNLHQPSWLNSEHSLSALFFVPCYK
jgi:hypothetical protein